MKIDLSILKKISTRKNTVTNIYPNLPEVAPPSFYKNVKTNSGNLLSDLTLDHINSVDQHEDFYNHVLRFMTEHIETYAITLLSTLFIEFICRGIGFYVKNCTKDKLQ